ncbi:MAG: carbon starvation CstA family protein, partial [Planctomycetota bacterium]
MFDHAAAVVAVCLVALFLGYRFYSRFLAVRIFETEDDDTPTPATTMQDGVDYMPTNRHVLLGHHFTSIAGAAPIVGPAVACVYGWVPAILWIVGGVIFMGAVQDYGALVVSVRNKGKSIGEVAASLIGHRARVLFLCLIVVLTWLVLAAFASIIGNLFHAYPASVFPVNLEIPIAIGIGFWVH